MIISLERAGCITPIIDTEEGSRVSLYNCLACSSFSRNLKITRSEAHKVEAKLIDSQFLTWRLVSSSWARPVTSMTWPSFLYSDSASTGNETGSVYLYKLHVRHCYRGQSLEVVSKDSWVKSTHWRLDLAKRFISSIADSHYTSLQSFPASPLTALIISGGRFPKLKEWSRMTTFEQLDSSDASLVAKKYVLWILPDQSQLQNNPANFVMSYSSIRRGKLCSYSRLLHHRYFAFAEYSLLCNLPWHFIPRDSTNSNALIFDSS